MVDRLLNFDAKLSHWLSLPLESPWRQLARVVAHLGDGPLVFGGLGLAYGLSWLLDQAQLSQEILTIILIVLAAIIVVTLIKFGIRRQRPRPPGEFVTFPYDAYSFPSGHAARLAALSASMIFFHPNLGWVFVAMTLSVAVARVAVGIHYVSDIIIGLALGALVAWAGLALQSQLSPL